jgi:hypothetical protein
VDNTVYLIYRNIRQHYIQFFRHVNSSESYSKKSYIIAIAIIVIIYETIMANNITLYCHENKLNRYILCQKVEIYEYLINLINK